MSIAVALAPKRLNAKAKGNRNERRSMRLFDALGYDVMRSAASLSTWDFIAWNANEVVFVQVKSSAWPGSVEMEAIRLAQVPSNGRKLVHRWMRGRHLPDVREV